ncbi:S-layer protein domain-containing protein [Methanolobus sp. ZRKC5]|uniref:S-layer protein domain-containing protein n=1 Tax=unclassified Methanolobus TaxID=2629569 RepID=UPI00313BE6F5
MACITVSASSTGPIYDGPDLDTIVGSENSDFLEMNASNFAEFIFDEQLRIYGGDFVSGRTIEEDGLRYHTSIVQADYQADFADENTGINKGTFPVIGLFTEEYVPLSDYDAGELVKLLVDSNDTYNLETGDLLELPNGYALAVKQIDVVGNKAWMELSRDGVLVEYEVIDITAGDATWDYDTDVGDQDDVIVFRALITEISQVDNYVVVEGFWLIDFQNVYEIETSDEFAILEVDSVSDSLSMVNYEPMNLVPDSVQGIAEGLKFKVNSSIEYLEFYLINESTEPIEPRTIYVNEDGTADYTTITEATYNANNGDTIIVFSGTYVENVFVDKELTIISESGDLNYTAVYAQNSNQSVFHVAADNVTISGFNVTGANDELFWPFAGIHLNEVENCNIANNVLSNNICGILLSVSNNNTLLNNFVSNNEVGILFEGSINSWLANNNVSNNYDGIALFMSNGNILNDNNISKNEYGIYLDTSQENTIYNNYFSNVQNIEIFESENIWNVTKTEGSNIIGGAFIGGNFWATPDGEGFSQTCNDTDGNGICDMVYELNVNNIDHLPLSLKQFEPIIPICDFTANTTFGIPPLTVQFTDLSTNTDSWEWDVDGDNIADYTTRNPVHTYTSIGSYNVTLTAGNMNSSDTKTVNNYISVSDPRANVSIEPSLIPLSGHLEPGDTFQVAVEVDCEEDNLRGIKLAIDYDNASLELNSENYEDLLGSDVLIMSRPSSGTYLFDLASRDRETIVPRSGTLLILNFQVKDEATTGVYALNLYDVKLTDENVAAIPTIVNDGQVSILNSSELTVPTVRIVTDTGPFMPGEEFYTTVRVNSVSYALNDIALQLNYDPSAVIVTNIIDDGIFGEHTLIVPGSGDKGDGLLTYKVNTTASSPVPVSGDVLTIGFGVKENATDGVYGLELENVLLKDENTTTMPNVMVSNTTFRISNASNVMPIVGIISPNESDIISGIQNIEAVDLSGDEDVVSTAFRIYADINGDGLVNDGKVWRGLGTDNNGNDGWNITFLSNEFLDGTYLLRVLMADGSGTSDAYRSVEIYNADTPFSMAKVVSETGPFKPGQNFQATIKVISNGYPLDSINLQLNYDPSAINITGITNENLLGNSTTAGIGIGGNNAIASVIYGINVIETINEPISGNLLTIGFEVTENASEGTYSLDLENVVFRDENNTAIPDTVVFNTVIQIANATDPIDGEPDEEPGDEIPVDDEETDITGITLQPGWNLISFPENLDEPSIDDVLRKFSDDEIDIVFYNDANSGMMIIPVEFEPLKGYWVHNNMSESAVVDETYLKPKIPAGPPSLTLYSGWNAIGHTAKVELPAEYALITIDNLYTEIRGPWIPAEKKHAYIGYNNEEGIIGGNQVGTDVFNMSMYEGYYVFVEDECVLA